MEYFHQYKYIYIYIYIYIDENITLDLLFLWTRTLCVGGLLPVKSTCTLQNILIKCSEKTSDDGK